MTSAEYGLVVRLTEALERLAFAIEVLNVNYAGTLPSPAVVPPPPTHKV